MDDLNRIIANNISMLRTVKGMTQLELAEKLNYSDKLISKWERGEGAPNAQTLQQLSLLFGVSVDYLFHDHGDEEHAVPEIDRGTGEKTKRRNRALITGISIVGIWMVALLVFIVLWKVKAPYWRIFVYALPVSFITLLVFNSLWHRGKRNFFILSALAVSVAVSVYVSLLKYNFWQIFLLIIPAELLILLSTRLKRPKRR